MNRRSFIAGVGAALAGAALDPDRLLWRPGARLISVPAPIVVDRVLAYEAIHSEIWEGFIVRRGSEVFGCHFHVDPRAFHPAGHRRDAAQAELARQLGTSPALVPIPEPRWLWGPRVSSS